MSAIVLLVFRLFPLGDKCTLILDRTNWKWGKTPINILMLSIAYRGIGIPLFWVVLNLEGNSCANDRVDLLKRVVERLGISRIEALLADREFIGTEWFCFLIEQKIPFIIRIKQNSMVRIGENGKLPIGCLRKWLSREKVVKLIRKNYYRNPELEFERLSLSIDIWDRVIEELTTMGLNNFLSKEKELLSTVMIGRALEIQRIYKSTHHVFIHAQSSDWLVFSDLVKELTKTHFPDRNLHQFKFLRIPPREGESKTITKYSKAEHVYDHQPNTRDDLISADAYFLHAEAAESAFFFMSVNRNITSKSYPFIRHAIKFFHRELSKRELESYTDQVAALTKNDPSKIGNLFLVCIPKEKSEEIQYRSHPFGNPCRCSTEENSQQILEQLQNLEIGMSCMKNFCPQYRLFTPKLTPENNVKMYLLSSEEDYRRKVKEGIRQIVQDLTHIPHRLSTSELVWWFKVQWNKISQGRNFIFLLQRN